MEVEIIRDLPPMDLPRVTFAEIRSRLENSFVQRERFQIEMLF